MNATILWAATRALVVLALLSGAVLFPYFQSDDNAQRVFNLLALTIALAWYLRVTRHEDTRAVATAGLALGCAYALVVVMVGHWVPRDDRFTDLGLVAYATVYSAIVVGLVRLYEWWRHRGSKRNAAAS
jgi:MFS family permease